MILLHQRFTPVWPPPVFFFPRLISIIFFFSRPQLPFGLEGANISGEKIILYSLAVRFTERIEREKKGFNPLCAQLDRPHKSRQRFYKCLSARSKLVFPLRNSERVAIPRPRCFEEVRERDHQRGGNSHTGEIYYESVNQTTVHKQHGSPSRRLCCASVSPWLDRGPI